MGLEFLEGNEAIARAAIKAGCRFFAGYPITPASTILSNMLQLLPPAGGVCVQGEDEIASIGFCIGAAMAGVKTMTATSGPGISLYSENIGLAIIGETPLVIVDVQRQGPATGSATKGADGDIQFARWVTSGGLPIIALCPATVAEAYELTYRAFNLAEAYRTPVFVMSNKEVSMTSEVVDLDAIELPPPVSRRHPPDGGVYNPYQFDRIEEVPPLADIGDEHVTRYTTSTHNKAGYLTADPDVIQEMIDHYAAKIEAAADDIALYREDLQDGAETLVLSYGVTSRAATVAVRQARGKGRRVSSLILQTLYPVPERLLRQAMQRVRRVVVPEMNLGQYRREIERLAPAGVVVSGVNRMDTTLLSPAEIELRGEL
ncbi:MAG: pyruvate flavodoxin/ferredoxin oxidoreductase [Hyphomicrobiales bacterium]|nr:pyruvate flavodoxin/ferredoxin oxidoreductase [Hyphomicrobiales bacterium]